MYFVYEVDKHKLFYQILNIVTINDDTIIIPNVNKKNIKKIADKLRNKISKTNSKKIIISKNLWKKEKFINFLYTYGLEIIDGKVLFQILAVKILEKIIKEKKEKNLRITILVNDTNEIIIENVKKILMEYKNITIVTKYREKFKNFERKYLNQEGIMLAISNNKRKSLVKSDIILNFDFPKEVLETYSIKDDAVIVNFSEHIKVLKKRFHGRLINNYDIVMPESMLNECIKFDKQKEGMFFQRDMCEAYLSFGKDFELVTESLLDIFLF